jgi:hypothetical protein
MQNQMNPAANTDTGEMAEIEDAMAHYATDFENYGKRFRHHYQEKFAGSHNPYDFYEPAYRFGFALAGKKTYHQQGWDALEAHANQVWEEQNPGSWQDYREAIRFGFDVGRNP